MISSVLLVLIVIIIASITCCWTGTVWLYQTAISSCNRPTTTSSTPMTQPAPVPTTDTECAICLDQPTAALQTNCGHVFCGTCIGQLLSSRPGSTTHTRCPLCRREITTLFTNFTTLETGSAAAHESQRIADTYNARFSGDAGPTFQRVHDLPVIMARIAADPASWYSLLRSAASLRMLLATVGGFIYTILPIDLVPEAVLGPIGLIDDAMVWVFVAAEFARVYQHVQGEAARARLQRQ